MEMRESAMPLLELSIINVWVFRPCPVFWLHHTFMVIKLTNDWLVDNQNSYFKIQLMLCSDGQQVAKLFESHSL